MKCQSGNVFQHKNDLRVNVHLLLSIKAIKRILLVVQFEQKMNMHEFLHIFTFVCITTPVHSNDSKLEIRFHGKLYKALYLLGEYDRNERAEESRLLLETK